jgi:hypothetical protein
MRKVAVHLNGIDLNLTCRGQSEPTADPSPARLAGECGGLAMSCWRPVPSATDDCDNLTVRAFADADDELEHQNTEDVTAPIGDFLPDEAIGR